MDDQHGIIIIHESYVEFTFQGLDGDWRRGSEPLLGAQRQTKKKAVNKILNMFAHNGVESHEFIKA